MSRAAVAVTLFAVAMAVTVALGVASGRGRVKSLAEWSISGRGLGTLFVLLLMAGETYTSFSFLGAAGWSYRYGVPIFYLIAYLSTGLVVAYFVAPLLWTYCARHRLVSIADIAEHRFGSRTLGVVVAVLATVFLIPYVQLQIQGMGVVVQAMSYGAVDLRVAAIVSFLVAETFVLVSGLRGAAWVSVLKDGLAVGAVVFLAIWVPWHYFDGPGELLNRLVAERPQWLTFPGAGDGTFGTRWYVSTIVLNAATICIFPTTVAGYLAAANPTALRRNSILLPWYQLLLVVPILIGAAALFVFPALGNSDLALYELVTDSLPAPLVALIGIAGALSAIVPMSVFLVAIGTLWGRTILGGGVAGAGRQRSWSRVVCVVVGAIALAGALLYPRALVNLSVLSYEGIAQLLPAVLLGLYWRRLTAIGVAAGLVVGGAIVFGLHAMGRDPLFGVNGGLVALGVNVLVASAVSLLPRRTRTIRIDIALPQPVR
ncbi:sodium:solute symporter family protein [Nocardia sp. CDC159]|uniref:Sodium:solute symporter family protein n=1 Tax=Nocardia pulmonis TaxID=2951408 RepID=A0A9X2IYN5_9NOCA|nr:MULTISPECIES: sodium:solute symporter family protein [Nocardia]MCM6775195.1 sodium:solute symporter family protein [Nocardia pulmonis]MCM6789665.1 sodium:solute symporter family protein [Nocardia sp. CDC159]